MSELKTSTEEIVVHLVRPGIGEQDYHLSVGATLADLLRPCRDSPWRSTTVKTEAVFVDGVPHRRKSSWRLRHEGGKGVLVVTIVPPTRRSDAHRAAMSRGAARHHVPAFRDEVLFQEYSDTLKALREEVDPDEEGPGQVIILDTERPRPHGRSGIQSGSDRGRTGRLRGSRCPDHGRYDLRDVGRCRSAD